MEAQGWEGNDIECFFRLYHNDNLRPLDPDAIRRPEVLTKIVCTDGLITHDTIRHTGEICGHSARSGVLTRIDLIGGPVMLDPSTPLYKDEPGVVEANVFATVHKLREMIGLKKCRDTCALNPHHICGGCKKYKVPLEDVLLRHTPGAERFLKDTFRREFPNLTFPIWPHLQLGRQTNGRGELEPNMMRMFHFDSSGLRLAA
jgi:hypothetical protein